MYSLFDHHHHIYPSFQIPKTNEQLTNYLLSPLWTPVLISSFWHKTFIPIYSHPIHYLPLQGKVSVRETVTLPAEAALAFKVQGQVLTSGNGSTSVENVMQQ